MNEQWFQDVNRWAGHWAWLDKAMIFFAQDLVWVLLAILVWLWMTRREGNQRAVVLACLTVCVSLAVAGGVLSPLIHQPRPFVGHAVHQLIPHAADSSFPSDHATLAFSLAFGVLWINKRWGAAMIGLAVLTGLGRVYVGVHYPADILGAAELSLLVSLVVFQLRGRVEPLSGFAIRTYEKLVTAVRLPSKH